MKNNQTFPAAATAECNRQYTALPSPYTLCLLGMGGDGHTASLFPDAHGLENALDAQQHCAAIQALPTDVTGDLLDRMTMTPWALLKSRQIVLLITGEAKWTVYRQAREGGARSGYPVSLFLNQSVVPVHIYWAP